MRGYPEDLAALGGKADLLAPDGEDLGGVGDEDDERSSTDSPRLRHLLHQLPHVLLASKG